MVKLLLGLDRVPSPHDAADALAVAICHLHQTGRLSPARSRDGRQANATALPKSWRQYRPPTR
jgi:hypothetical protein